MNCPNCGELLSDVQAKSHYGSQIKISQCPNCGGIWCNGSEMVSVSPDDAKRIDEVDVSKLSNPSLIKKELHCPKCGNPLQNFKDPSFPQQIKVSYCTKDMGYWFNRGELAEYKEWQKTSGQKPAMNFDQKDQEFKGQMESFLKNAKDNNYDSIKNIGGILHDPVVYPGPRLEHPNIPFPVEMLLNIASWILLGY
jgi:Zn-finger nucleic acid-binding protein